MGRTRVGSARGAARLALRAGRPARSLVSARLPVFVRNSRERGISAGPLEDEEILGKYRGARFSITVGILRITENQRWKGERRRSG